MLHLHRSERADALVAPLAALLADAPPDPFTPDVLAVPTRGVERWLAQRLSHHLGAVPGEPGICANVTFGSPSRLVAEVLAGLPGAPQEDPWAPDRLVWPLLEVIDAHAAEPWCAPLGRYLAAGDPDDLRHGRRLGAARHLARLYASYAAQRPDMVRAWADGRDEDGAGGPVPDDLTWQAELWRRLRAYVGSPGPAERLEEALAVVTDNPGAVDLPARLGVFGPTRLPEEQLCVLRALARGRDVHLWLPHPSPALWARVARAARPASRRRRDQPVRAEHPLLVSMARDTTELQTRLLGDGVTDTDVTDTHHPAPRPRGTLLHALQDGLVADSHPAEQHRLDPHDPSVQVHACHGLARQVEVLREVLAGLFAQDPTLEPRDVIVMCPDVEAVAPLVTASFGLAPEGVTDVHPGHTMRVRLADRAPGRTNPVLGVLAALLGLADGRVTASEVLDLAATEPVRRRFRLSDDDVDRVRGWAADAGVRWGEDVRRRERFALPGLLQGTWHVALDRLLLGAAMAEEDHRYVGHALPLDDVDSTDVDLAGRLAEFVDRLTDLLAALDGVHPLRHWLDTLDRAVTLLTDTAPADSWQLVQARRVLGDVRADATDPALRLPDVRGLLTDRLAGRPTRAGFRTGALTVCSLEPMRAVPHRVVCLLGLDDSAFPRGTRQDGDDVLLREPCVGERDRRSEDRQLFLDAVTAAQDHLVVLYSGAHERTGAARPPAVPVAELLDALDHTAEGADVRAHVVRHHPLQVVDERNFTAGALGRPGAPFSFDAVAHRAALAGRGERQGRAPFLPAPLPPTPAADTLDLADLVAVLEHPVKYFLRRRLGLSVAGEVAEVADRLPLTLAPLDGWAIGERFLQARLAGVPDQQVMQAEWRRGAAPPRELGRAALLDVGSRVVPIAAAAAQERGAAAAQERGSAAAPQQTGEATAQQAGAAAAQDRSTAEAVDVLVTLPSGTTLTGTVPGVHGTTVLRATYSRLAPKHRLRAWVQLLALAAAHPGRPWDTATVARPDHRRPGAYVARLTSPGPERALELLDELVGLHALALREPLPVPVPVACTYATSRSGGDSADMAIVNARRAWDGDQFLRDDEHHVVCWGRDASLDDLAGTPTPAEQAWYPQDPTRLGVLARRVWEPLLAHERVDKP